MPKRFMIPAPLQEAFLITELGYPPEVYENWPEHLIEEILIYKGVKNVTINGGDWQP